MTPENRTAALSGAGEGRRDDAAACAAGGEPEPGTRVLPKGRAAPVDVGEGRRVAVIVNGEAGSAPATHAPDVARDATRAGLQVVETVQCSSSDVEARLTDFCQRESVEAFLVLGGDGTARTVARFASACGAAIAPLPFGTMNLLARRVYGARSPRDIVASLGEAERAPLAGGVLNGEMFLLSAALGFPVPAAAARERVRGGLSAAPAALEDLSDALALAQQARVLYRCGVRHGRAAGLVVAVGMLEALTGDEVVERAPKAFSVAAAQPQSIGDLSTLVMRVVTGAWRDHPTLDVFAATAVRARMTGAVRVALDGDPVDTAASIRISWREDAAHVLAPRGASR